MISIIPNQEIRRGFIFPHEIFEGFELKINSKYFILKKDESIPHEILQSGYIPLITKGVVVLYWDNGTDDKTIFDFKSEGEILQPANEISKNKHGDLNGLCAQNSEIILINDTFISTCALLNPEISKFYKQLLTDNFSATYNQIKFLKEGDLEKRYEIFLREYKHIYNDITDRMIANYLGAHYTTLSRVKSRMITKLK